MRKTKIIIDYSICGDGNKIDPRDCAICMKVCDPALFLIHQSLDYFENDDQYDPQIWRITPVYPSLCTHCMNCVEQCPEKAIIINW
ncbi:MAG: 4Fe-4S dicluster domain-containing protein [Candidatus Hermodarchaeota archaeon]